MSTVGVKIVTDTATPLLKRLRGAVVGTRANVVVGRAVAELWRNHLYAKDRTEPNRLGGGRTHFYAKAADAISFRAGKNQVVVVSSHRGLRQRFLGGPIVAKPGKALAIPVHPKAHGKSPREFGDLFLLKTGRGKGATAILAQDKGRSKLEVFYVLKKRVDQKGDPTVLPPEAKIGKTAEKVVHRFLNLVIQQG